MSLLKQKRYIYLCHKLQIALNFIIIIKWSEIMGLDVHSKHVLDVVSANVKKFRKVNDMSQLTLSLEIGFTNSSYVGKAERRTTNHHFNIVHLSKISKVLDVDICEFFKEDDIQITKINAN